MKKQTQYGWYLLQWMVIYEQELETEILHESEGISHSKRILNDRSSSPSFLLEQSIRKIWIYYKDTIILLKQWILFEFEFEFEIFQDKKNHDALRQAMMKDCSTTSQQDTMFFLHPPLSWKNRGGPRWWPRKALLNFFSRVITPLDIPGKI